MATAIDASAFAPRARGLFHEFTTRSRTRAGSPYAVSGYDFEVTSTRFPGWYVRFKRDLFALSYDEVVATLLDITEGRLNPHPSIEVEIAPDLTVRVSASPRLRVAPDADVDTEQEVRLLEKHLEVRDLMIHRVAQVIAWEQQGYLRGVVPSPVRLDVDAIAVRAGASHETVLACIRNKLVIHPRGLAKLEALVTPPGDPALVVAARHGGPTDPSASAEAAEDDR